MTGGRPDDAGKGAANKPPPFVARVIGSGRPLILIPGGANGGNVWDRTVAHFQDRFECHVVTVAGFAGQPAVGEPFLEQVRDALIGYIRERKLERPVLVGHSLGGFLALWVAVGIPQEVGPIVSVDWPPFSPLGLTPEEARQHAEALRDRYRRKTPDEFAREVRRLLLAQIRDPKEAERVAEQAIKSDPTAVGSAFVEVRDLRDQVRMIRTPVLLLGQTYGHPNPPEKERQYRSQMAAVPRHKVVMARKAGHYIQLDEPEFFLREVEAFLKEAEADRGRLR